LTIPHLSFAKAIRKTFLLNFDQIKKVFTKGCFTLCFAVSVSLDFFFKV